MSYNFKVTFYDDEIQVSSFPNIITKGGMTSEKSVTLSKQDSFLDDSIVEDSEKNHSACIVRSLRRTKQSIYTVARANDWQFFATFTLSDSTYRYDFLKSCKKLRTWFSNFKQRTCNDLEYIVVPEFHKDGAVHFHALLQSSTLISLLKTRWCDRSKFYLPSYSLGISELEKVKDRYRVSNYICKYITKELQSYSGKHRYFRSQGLKLPVTNEYLCEGVNIMEFLDMYYPEYNIVHSVTGEFDSCYIQLKIKQ